jgi:3-phenylpropionate/cinnamic acid dioxygenase small subunit
MTSSNLTHRLADEVVILENREALKTGAQSLAPDHSPRAPVAKPSSSVVQGIKGLAAYGSLREKVEQFLYLQSELLDQKLWDDVINLFAEDGVYWMPVTPDQTEWLDSPSIFAEDKHLMQVRAGRVTHPNAWSQAAQWGTSHVVGNVVIESATDDTVQVRSRFHVTELRRDALRHFAGTYKHTLRRVGDDFKIVLQRVDMLNAQAPFEYVLQIWV